MSESERTGDLLGQISGAAKKGLPPVHLWNPPFCGDIDMRIARDGTWFYQGTPIGRPAMVRLFSTVLRRDDDRFFLVTPVEKVGITVDDAPFVVTQVTAEGSGESQRLRCMTNVEDEVIISAEHPLRVETAATSQEPRPYIHIRANLEALVSRSVFYQLVELAVPHSLDGQQWLGVWSAGSFFPLGRA
ncbi:DUF1285 domain-containing protein [Stutzerimonas urumqiensis]|uniref:DUF1285 domain-containing protein n=1 Tax=Stutzerimonas urumqiensis TaxID=638269 RepID=UPI003DA30F42